MNADPGINPVADFKRGNPGVPIGVEQRCDDSAHQFFIPEQGANGEVSVPSDPPDQKGHRFFKSENSTMIDHFDDISCKIGPIHGI